MKTNILFIIESSETGGAESIFAELIKRIDLERFTPHVALLYEGWLFDRLNEDGVAVHLLSTSKGGFDFALLKGILTDLKRLDIDLVHSHLFTTNLYASVAGALAGVPVISTFHGTMDVNIMDRFKKLKWTVLNTFSRKIVFVSQYLCDYFVSAKLAKRETCQIIYNGIEVTRFTSAQSSHDARHRLGLHGTCFVVGCVGDLRPAKDYETALRAVAILKRVIPEVVLVIAGTLTPLLAELKSLSKNLGIDENVLFLGHVPDIENIFPAFDVYLSTSVSEGFSLTVVEAMAAGLPVIATRSGGPAEIIQDGYTGLLVNIGMPSEIASAIESLYRDRSSAVAMSIAGRDKAEATFSIQKMVDAYQGLYSQLLEK